MICPRKTPARKRRKPEHIHHITTSLQTCGWSCLGVPISAIFDISKNPRSCPQSIQAPHIHTRLDSTPHQPQP